MADNVFSKIATFINRVVDTISQGNLERVTILREYNITFREAFIQGDINILCKVTTASGNPSFKHALSSFYLRSGFKITIENDNNLRENDLIELSKYFIENKAGVRQLMAFGYDTLIMVGKNSSQGIQIPFKEIANLQEYMLNQ
jgi:hypothetical protein